MALRLVAPLAPEEQRESEHVIHRQWLLDHEAGEVVDAAWRAGVATGHFFQLATRRLACAAEQTAGFGRSSIS